MSEALEKEMAFWLECHETASTKGGALVAWGIYAGLRIAKDGSLDDAHKEMAGQLFELRADNERLRACRTELDYAVEYYTHGLRPLDLRDWYTRACVALKETKLSEPPPPKR
jgi:hypothetical protein